jgi:hypothetical protein
MGYDKTGAPPRVRGRAPSRLNRVSARLLDAGRGQDLRSLHDLHLLTSFLATSLGEVARIV